MHANNSTGRSGATAPFSRSVGRAMNRVNRARTSCVAAALLAGASPALAGDPSSAVAGLAKWLEQKVNLPDGRGLRIEVKVGSLPRGLRLPDCDRAEPFLPPNAKLWGRANVGLRCVAGGTWKTWIPVTVSAWGPAVVARRPLVPGQAIAPDAIEIREVDWAATPRPPIADPGELAGKELLRPVPAGRPIQADHLRTAPTVRLGDAVPLTLTGSGFTIRVLATALGSGADGQRISVRTPTGKVVNGRIEGTGVVLAR